MPAISGAMGGWGPATDAESYRFDMVFSARNYYENDPAGTNVLNIQMSGMRVSDQVSRLGIKTVGMSDLIRSEIDTSEMEVSEIARVNAELKMLDIPIGMRTVDGQAYVYLDQHLERIGLGEKDWVAVDADDEWLLGWTDLALFIDPLDPSSMLSVIDATRDIEVVGTETRDGTVVTHYRGVLESGAAEAKASGEGLDLVHSLIALDLSEAALTTDFWLGDDGFLRRLRVTPPEEPVFAADGVTVEYSEVLKMEITLSSLGEDLIVAPPEAGLVIDRYEIRKELADVDGFVDIGA